MKPSRDDLIYRVEGIDGAYSDVFEDVTDDDLARLGYVKFDEIEGQEFEMSTEWISIPADSVDVEALRDALRFASITDSEQDTIARVARQVLDALDEDGEIS